MKKSKPGFGSYFKCVIKNKYVITSKNGISYNKRDMMPRIFILIIIWAIFFVLLLVNYADFTTRIFISVGFLFVQIIAYIPLVYLFTKFAEVNEDDADDEIQGVARVISKINTEKRDS